MCEKRGVVGIFSLEHSGCYDWLTRFLLESSLVREVRCIYVSNNVWDLGVDISACSFAILYHTKNRGRVNVTDVKDALYDAELSMLSRRLGRRNVLVVIDDLEDTSEMAKTFILENQPKISRLAQDLFLFGTRKDEKYQHLRETSRGWSDDDNLQKIENAVRAHNQRLWAASCRMWAWLYVGLFIVLLIVIFIVLEFGLGNSLWHGISSSPETIQ